jgi:hypothetical protein
MRDKDRKMFRAKTVSACAPGERFALAVAWPYCGSGRYNMRFVDRSRIQSTRDIQRAVRPSHPASRRDTISLDLIDYRGFRTHEAEAERFACCQVSSETPSGTVRQLAAWVTVSWNPGLRFLRNRL